MSKHIFLTILFIFSIQKSISQTKTQRIKKSFKSFFDGDKVEPSKCFDNIQFFLEELFENEKNLKGFVVGFDHGPDIHHLDARWSDGSHWDTESKKYIQDEWENGKIFNLKNYHNHYFLVIDDLAYDFSQAGKKSQTLRSYLQTSYLPPKGYKSKTSYLIVGHLDRLKAESSLNQTKMFIYSVDEYSQEGRRAKPIYTGKADDLFKHKDLIKGKSHELSKVLNQISSIAESKD